MCKGLHPPARSGVCVRFKPDNRTTASSKCHASWPPKALRLDAYTTRFINSVRTRHENFTHSLTLFVCGHCFAVILPRDDHNKRHPGGVTLRSQQPATGAPTSATTHHCEVSVLAHHRSSSRCRGAVLSKTSSCEGDVENTSVSQIGQDSGSNEVTSSIPVC